LNKLVEGQFVQIANPEDSNVYINCYVKDVFDEFMVIKGDSGCYRILLKNLDARIKDDMLIIPTLDGEPVMVKKAWGEYTFTPDKKKKKVGGFRWNKKKIK
jgi:hypothetical protein